MQSRIGGNLHGYSQEVCAKARGRRQHGGRNDVCGHSGCSIAIFISFGLWLAHWPTGTTPTGVSFEDFTTVMIVIYASLFVGFNIFVINMVLQRLKIGKWADYLHGERAYTIRSLVAKSLLDWQVWSGVFQPASN